VKHVEELGIPELTSEQIEEVCTIAEEEARKYVASKIPRKHIERLNVTAEVEGARPVTVTIDVDIGLTSAAKGFNVQKVADEAVKEGIKAAEKHMRDLKCRSQT